MKHQWEPTDTEGVSLQCERCGATISALEEPDKNGERRYDKLLDAEDCTPRG